MTQNKAQKTAVRQRMSETGEPYSVARHVVEAGQAPSGPPEPPQTGRNATPRDDTWYAMVAEEAGISVGEFKAQEEAARLSDLAEDAQRRADAAQERADLAQEQAGQAEEVAELAQAAADLATEAAELTRSAADEQERERAQQRADEAALARDRAQQAAELAQERAEREQELAERAEEAADQAQEHADELAEDSRDEDGEGFEGFDDEDGPEDWHRDGWNWERAAGEHHGHGPHHPGPPHGPGPDWNRFEYLGDRLQDRVDTFRQRFDLARERAEQMISQAERIMKAARGDVGHPGGESRHTDEA
jgi:multidrug efflux pump subunit AcrA (membrane-fusion protein)